MKKLLTGIFLLSFVCVAHAYFNNLVITKKDATHVQVSYDQQVNQTQTINSLESQANAAYTYYNAIENEINEANAVLSNGT